MDKDQALSINAFSLAVLDEMPDMVRVLDAEGNIFYANNALKQRFGDLQATACEKVPEMAGCFSDCIALKCIRDKHRYSTVLKTGGRIYTINAGPVFFDNKAYALEILTDVTHEQKLKDKLITNNSRMMKDLEVARSLQLSILRHNLPVVQNYRFCTEFLPCEALGGDMFDCFLARDGRIIMYIADVSGHGVMPAMLTVYLRQEVFAQCKTPDISPSRVLKNIQDSFEELNTEESIYITIFIIALNPKTGEFIFANAGHSVPPLVAGKNGVRELFLPGTPICRWAGLPVREEQTDRLGEGEKLFLYTDGLDGIHTGEASNQKLKGILMRDNLRGKQLLDEIKMKFTQTKADDVTMLLCERDE